MTPSSPSSPVPPAVSNSTSNSIVAPASPPQLRSGRAALVAQGSISDVSHQLHSPLNSIIGFAELLHDGKVGPLTEQQTEFLGDILSSARRLLQLIDSLLVDGSEAGATGDAQAAGQGSATVGEERSASTVEQTLAAPSTQSSESILVVDDEPLHRKFIQAFLEDEGYLVHVSPDAETALTLVESLHPKIIFTDIDLPGIDGFEMVRRLKSTPRTKHIIVVALSGFSAAKDRQAALDAGCDGYLSKPIDNDQLLALLAHHLTH